MSNGPLNTWSTVLAERRQALDGSEATNVRSEVAFQDKYKLLCNEHKERRPERLLARLQKQYDNATRFVDRMDGALVLEDETLTAIYYSSLLGIIAGAFGSHIKLQRLFGLLKDHDIPRFGDDVEKFVDNVAVQAPLQKIFVEFIDCHLAVAEHFSPRRTLPIDNFGQIEARLAEADHKFDKYVQEWRSSHSMAVEEQKNEIRRRAESLGSAETSVPNDLDGEKFDPTGRGISISYEHVKYLGHGSFGRVDAFRSAIHHELFALKSIPYANKAEEKQRKIDVMREFNAMKSLRHHHIASVNDCIQDPVRQTFSILMSPVGAGHLGHCLSGDLTGVSFGKQHDRWFGCLTTALCYAHAQKIIHQDIKPSNIIIKGIEVYLADFGAAKDFSRDESSRSSDNIIEGTPNYMAPEDKPGVERGRATDVFSLGCVFAEMLTVRQGDRLDDFRESRRKSDQVYPFVYRDNLSKVQEWLFTLNCRGTAEFLRDETLRMIKEDSKDRPDTMDLRRLFKGEGLVCHSCRL